MPKFIFTTILLSLTIVSYCQQSQQIRVAFYNLENFFDTYNDSTTRDDDFTPRGAKFWSKKKFEKKCSNIYKTILAIGDENPVAILGVCEVENKLCLNTLLKNTPLQTVNYKYIHYNSPDSRGIDVALLYIAHLFYPINHRPIKVTFDNSPHTTTRDILYVKGTIPSGDTLHIFVCHLPSRLGDSNGERRTIAAKLIKRQTDSILNANNNANIIIMGDMNDEPYDNSMITLCDTTLINISFNIIKYNKTGTLKHGAFWSIFDQIIVSKNLLSDAYPKINNKRANVFNKNFLLSDDKKYGGKKLFRTYSGPRYLGGYSDHLPVYIDILYTITDNKP